MEEELRSEILRVRDLPRQRTVESAWDRTPSFLNDDLQSDTRGVGDVRGLNLGEGPTTEYQKYQASGEMALIRGGDRAQMAEVNNYSTTPISANGNHPGQYQYGKKSAHL